MASDAAGNYNLYSFSGFPTPTIGYSNGNSVGSKGIGGSPGNSRAFSRDTAAVY